MSAFPLKDQKLRYGNFLLLEQYTFTRWVWFVAKKTRSSFTQRMSDLPKDTDPVGSKINPVTPLSLDSHRREKKVKLFHCDSSLPELGQTSAGPRARFLSRLSFPRPRGKYKRLRSSVCPSPHAAGGQHQRPSPQWSGRPG